MLLFTRTLLIQRSNNIKPNLNGMLMLKGVGQRAPVWRHVVDTHVRRLVEIQFDPVRRRTAQYFWQLERLFFTRQPDTAAVSSWCAPCHRDMPHVTSTQHNKYIALGEGRDDMPSLRPCRFLTFFDFIVLKPDKAAANRMLGRSSGNHDWLLANASDCVWMETGL